MAEADDKSTAEDEETEEVKEEVKAEETVEAKAEEEEKVEEKSEEKKEPNWRDTIEDEKVRKFVETFTSPKDLADTAFGFRQKLSNAIQKPGKNATEEETVAFKKALGVPESADAFKVSVPDDMPEGLEPTDEGLNVFKEVAHKANLNQESFDTVMNWYFDLVKGQSEAAEKTLEDARTKNGNALQKEWGNDFSKNNELAVRAAEGHGGEEFTDFLDNTIVDGMRLGDHPIIIKTFAKIGRQMTEADPLIMVSEEDAQSLRDEHSELTGKMLTALDKGDVIEAKRLERQRDKITPRISGNQPIVGSAGRTV